MTYGIANTSGSGDTISNLSIESINRNLLHNWDFRNPVNQQGKASYTIAGVNVYTIDRWSMSSNNGTATFDENGLHLSGDNYRSFQQVIADPEALDGKTLTFSVEYNGVVKSLTAVLDMSITGRVGGNANYINIDDTITPGYFYIELKVSDAATLLAAVCCGAGIVPSYSISRMKLELGSVSTLASDKPADYAEQYAICAQYDMNSGERVGLVTQNDLESLSVESINRNLLHNWDFRNPVNRNGLTTYTNTAQCTIDRWKVRGDTVTLTLQSDGIDFTSTGGSDLLTQEIDPKLVLGKIVTMSVIINDTLIFHTVEVPSALPDSGTTKTTIGDTVNASANTFGLRPYLRLINSKLTVSLYADRYELGTTVRIKSFKLEIGSVSTLENDKPAEYAEQYALCAQYDPTTGNRTGLATLDENGVVPGTQNYSYMLWNATQNRTLQESDVGRTLMMYDNSDTSKNYTITVPAHADVAINWGAEIAILRYFPGNVTITPAEGVGLRYIGVVNTSRSVRIANRYGMIALKKVSDSNWLVTGDIEEVV